MKEADLDMLPMMLFPCQVCNILNISRPTLEKLCNDGQISYIKLNGKHKRFSKKSVMNLIDANV